MQQSPETIIKLYQNNVTITDIARQYHLSKRTILNILKQHNVWKCRHRNTITHKSKKQEYPEALINKIQILYHNQGLTLKEVSEELSLSPKELKTICKSANIKIKLFGESNKSSKLFNISNKREELVELYKTYNMEEIGEILSCDRYIVADLFKHHKIPRKKENRSSGENAVGKYVLTLVPDIATNDKKQIHPYELDIFIPDKKIAVEYCGLYWHSERTGKDKEYHLRKLKMCNALGITLITLFEDEWLKKQDIVKNELAHVIGRTNIKRINADTCQIKELSVEDKDCFLNKFHLSGSDNSEIRLGLFHNNILVSVMTFSKIKNKIWELNRFSTNTDYYIVDGKKKLLSYFEKNNVWDAIYYYADLRWSTGKTYEMVGFEIVENSPPNYWYLSPGSKIRNHKDNFTKELLLLEGYPEHKSEEEIMKERDFVRVWDCGVMTLVKRKK